MSAIPGRQYGDESLGCQNKDPSSYFFPESMALNLYSNSWLHSFPHILIEQVLGDSTY